METPIDIDICIDCLFVLANGVETDEQAQCATRMAELWPNTNITINCDESCEGHFSWKQCEGCGSTLGGDRHPAVAWVESDDSSVTGESDGSLINRLIDESDN